MKKLLTFLTVLLFAVVGLGAGSIFYLYKQWEKPSPLKTEILLEIPKGYGAAQVGKLLQKNEVIESARSFKWWCSFHPDKVNFKTGWYSIPTGQSIEQIAALLSSGKTVSMKVTIPEGKATWEITGLLARSSLKLDSAKLDSLMRSKTFVESLGIEAKDLEGYMFPSTYNFPIGTDEQSALKALVRENLRVRDEFQAKNSPIWKELGNWHRVLTLASIVEKETGLPEDAPHIAGVFLNRFRIGMQLGADVTVRFIFRNLAGPIYKSQLESNSPYNTRKFTGLTPGPISNPGRLSIEAVLFPMQTENLYFVAKEDGSKELFFSKTLIQHNVYKKISEKNSAAN